MSRNINNTTVDSMNDGECSENENKNKRLERSLTGLSSVSSVLGVSDRSVTRKYRLHQSKIDSLIKSVNEKHDGFLKIMLTCKETAVRRESMESAFRYCKEAFLEMTTMLTCLMEERQLIDSKIGDIKTSIREAVNVSNEKDDG